MKKILQFHVLLLCAITFAFGQGEPSRAPGVAYATAYNRWAVRVAAGNSATGTQTITLSQGYVSLPDGRVITPFNTSAPLTVDTGSASAETVTPTTVSGCGFQAPPGGLPTCSITATFANTHGPGAVVSSGSFGLQEALNDLSKTTGGVVVVDSSFGGTSTTISAATTFSNAGILDLRSGVANVGSQLLEGACTGTAVASSTLGLEGLGTFAVGTCTSTTVTVGIPMTRAGTLRNLSVSAGTGGVNTSSGGFTVLKNGAATTITCTCGTGTSCSDTTHTTTFVQGDIISVQFTTQAAETLANVKVSVLAQ
jgi:hypothetical protein